MYHVMAVSPFGVERNRSNVGSGNYLDICRAINSPSDCLLLQSDIDCIQEWCSANFMKPTFSKIRVIFVFLYYHRKNNLPFCSRYIVKRRTLEKTLSWNGLQQSMHCCAVSSRYLVTFLCCF
jgi:hypothetical protein